MENIVSLCKRRGFIFPSSGIYGGINGCWDFGPLGVELKRNIKDDWWYFFVKQRADMVGLDSSILMHPEVWKASGHVDEFHDLMVDCKECKKRFREDQFVAEEDCPNKKHCDGAHLSSPKAFNMMLQTSLGASEESAVNTYLRPETCQSIFVNFKEVYSSARMQVPFGIAQVGKAFRNEINPRNFIFRSREFEQMEIEFFCKPEDEDSVFEEWKTTIWQWYLDIGLTESKMRWYSHPTESLAHYSSRTEDIEYDFPFGWGELQGLANRGCFDLTQHTKFSGKDLSFFDPTTQERFVPSVIEPSAGADRTVLAILCDAYCEEEVGTGEKSDMRTVLKLHPRIAPIKAAILPLVKKDGIAEIAQNFEAQLRKKFNTFYDQAGAIGRRYRRMDEAGTPFCICVDYDTKEDETVTVRERDSMEQVRMPMSEVAGYIESKCSFERD